MQDHRYTHKVYGVRLTVRRGKELRTKRRIGNAKRDDKDPEIIHIFCDTMPLSWPGHIIIVPMETKPPKAIPEPPEDDDADEDESDWEGPKRP